MESCGLECVPLDSSQGACLKGIGGKVQSLGKRQLRICIQLADGGFANGMAAPVDLELDGGNLLDSKLRQRTPT